MKSVQAETRSTDDGGEDLVVPYYTDDTCTIYIATAWHNIAAHRATSWGPVPASDRTRLMVQCIQVTPIANTILDPFMSTGDVLIATVRLRRKYVGIEIDEGRCAEAVTRLLERKNNR